MLRRRHRRFGRPRIDHDDLRLMRIAHHALPQDRVGDAEIAADEHDHVGLFEIGVGVGRRVEAKRLLVGDDGGGHALPRVAVAVEHAHAEFGERAEQRHFFGDDLAGAEERDRLGPCVAWIAFHAVDKRAERSVPIDRFELAGCVAHSGVVARSGASSTASASQPFGQAMPRFTG